MKPLEEALAFYAKTGGDLMADISAYATLGGYVFMTPHSLILFKRVKKDAGKPDEQWNTGGDAWYVRFAAGKDAISEFIERTPYPLPHIGWSRVHKNRPVKWFDFKTVLRRK
jgi:hypothetical protein